jgi:hypothetical protein
LKTYIMSASKETFVTPVTATIRSRPAGLDAAPVAQIQTDYAVTEIDT